MKYCDLHCDALSKTEGVFVTSDRLKGGNCHLQCFAVFVEEQTNRYEEAIRQIDKYSELVKAGNFHPVLRDSDVTENKINSLLSLEDGGAIEGSIKKLDRLYRRGVRMITLTWNHPNEIGFPNFKEGGKRETERGLTPFGFRVLEEMYNRKMIIDVSHGSDKLFSEVAEFSKRKGVPFVASHSLADSVRAHPRNLTDRQIRQIADAGGVVGLCFCMQFLSSDESEAGQREAMLNHLRAMINAGGEDVLAIGSDFDGTKENAYIKNPSDVPKLLGLVEREFGYRVAEKFARKNFLRVFKEITL